MGLIESIEIEDRLVRIEMVLTTGWCPFASRLLGMVEEEVGALLTVERVDVDVVWDPTWTPQRMSESAREKLRLQLEKLEPLREARLRGEPMIKDDVLVFDCVAHPFNFDASNAIGNAGELFRQHLYAFHNVLTPEDKPKLPADEFLKEWSTREISRMVFDESDTDILVAMPLPLTDLFDDGLSPWERCVELRDENPDRTVFWGTVNPLEGRKALEQMEIQVNEYGAKAFKFYNVRYDYGEPFPWRMDDPKVAFPIYEKAQELGINLIGVHKGVPLGPQPVEATQTWDMDGAAANFPDINFVIVHVGLPFIDETCWQLIRYPNLYASIAATINFVVRSPRQFAEWIGKLMFWCGEDKIIYGSETPIWHPKWALDAFWDFEIPQDLVEGYGYPQLTERAKRKILGENLLRLSGMDAQETRQRLNGAA